MKNNLVVLIIIVVFSNVTFGGNIDVEIENVENQDQLVVSKNIVKLISINNILIDALQIKVENDVKEEILIEKNLKNIDTYKTFKIYIYKDERILKFYGDDKIVGKFKTSLGKNKKEGTKEIMGDNMTPEGTFYICEKHHSKNYKLFMGLSYPGIEDAKKGLEKGFITEKEYNQIVKANKDKKTPLWNTKLGGTVGIHGGGSDYEGTRGCVQMDDDVIEFLWKYTPLGTEVIIQ